MYPVLLVLMTLGLVTIDNNFVVSVLTLAFAAAIAFSTKTSWRQRWMPYAMFLGALVIIAMGEISLFEVVGQTRSFSLTVLMIISITLIGALVNSSGIVHLYSRLRGGLRAKNENTMLIYSSVVASPLLNMATPVIYGEMFRNGSGTHDVSVANNVKYGMMIAMLVAPTFAPIALVIGAHPGIHWSHTLIYSLPIALITLLYFVLTSNSVFRLDMDKQAVSADSGLKWIVLYLVLMFALLMNDRFGVVVSIILAAQVTVLLAIISQPWSKLGAFYVRINRKCRDVLVKINNEALIFIASGILLVALTLYMQNRLSLLLFITDLDKKMLVPLVLLVLPLLSMLRLHPIIGFTLVQPLVYLNQDLAEIQKYILWVCYWAISLQISPISVINITTSNAFDIRAASLTTVNDFVKVYLLGLVYSLIIIFYGG